MKRQWTPEQIEKMRDQAVPMAEAILGLREAKTPQETEAAIAEAERVLREAGVL